MNLAEKHVRTYDLCFVYIVLCALVALWIVFFKTLTEPLSTGWIGSAL